MLYIASSLDDISKQHAITATASFYENHYLYDERTVGRVLHSHPSAPHWGMQQYHDRLPRRAEVQAVFLLPQQLVLGNGPSVSSVGDPS